ncbi:MAG: 3',5'-cyclic-AMP phosphodiesterase [Gammaproteobacteria bacterium]|nr:3',5'-cyclic-AMP phosphodiesterase [Gammaproteobacteria bacterium]
MSANPLRFIQLTDTHLSDPADGTLRGFNTAQSLAAVVEHIRTHEPRIDGILATGDLSHDGGTPSYRRFVQLLAPLDAPIYCLPGNHDALNIFSCALKGSRVHSGGRLLADNWQLIFLDSAAPGAVHGHLRPAELARLENALREHPERHTLICLHHQPVPIGSAWLDKLILDNADALFEVVDRHSQVRGILWGHVHQTFDMTRNDVRLLSSPSTCIQFKPGCDDFTLDDKAPGYRWLALHGNGNIDTDIVYIQY